MNRPTLFLASATVLGALALSGCGAPMARHQGDHDAVVLQVSDNDPAKWNLALNNARNIQQAYGDKPVQVEIVAYGPGIGMLKADSPVAARVTETVGQGVQVSACQNTMKAQKLTEADMNTKVSYVPAGVVEIMKREKEGWSYLRP